MLWAGRLLPFSKRQYRAIRGHSSPPARVDVDPATGSPTANPARVAELFINCWSKLYTVYRQGAPKPDFDAFVGAYGDHIPRKPWAWRPPTAQELEAYCAKMGSTAPGLDGWEAQELRRLPRGAWEAYRRLLVTATKDVRRWPAAFYHIDEPFLRKGEGRTVQEHRGLFISAVPHRIAIGAEWVGQA